MITTRVTRLISTCQANSLWVHIELLSVFHEVLQGGDTIIEGGGKRVLRGSTITVRKEINKNLQVYLHPSMFYFDISNKKMFCSNSYVGRGLVQNWLNHKNYERRTQKYVNFAHSRKITLNI